MATTFAPIEYIDSVDDILVLISPYLKTNGQAQILYKIMENLDDILITLGIEEISLGNEGKRENIFLIPSSDPLGRKVLIEEAKRNALAALTPFGISNPTPAMLIGKTFNTAGIDLGIYLSFTNTIPLIEITLSSEVLISAIGLVAIERDMNGIAKRLEPKKINKTSIIKMISEYQRQTHDDSTVIQQHLLDNPSQRNLVLFTVKQTLEEYKKIISEDSRSRSNRQLQLELNVLQKLAHRFFNNSDIIDASIRYYRTMFMVENTIISLEREIAMLCIRPSRDLSEIRYLMLEHDMLALGYLDATQFIKAASEMLFDVIELNRTLKETMPFIAFDEDGALIGIEKSIIEIDQEHNFLSASALAKRLKAKNKEFISFFNNQIGPYSSDIISKILGANSVQTYIRQRDNTLLSTLSIVTPKGLKSINVAKNLVSALGELPRFIVDSIETPSASNGEEDSSISSFLNNFAIDFIEENTKSEYEELASEPWYKSLISFILNKASQLASFGPKVAITFNVFFIYNAALVFPERLIEHLLNNTPSTSYGKLREIHLGSIEFLNGQQIELEALNSIITDLSSPDSLKKELSGLGDTSVAPFVLLGCGGLAALTIWYFNRRQKE